MADYFEHLFKDISGPILLPLPVRILSAPPNSAGRVSIPPILTVQLEIRGGKTFLLQLADTEASQLKEAIENWQQARRSL